MGISSRLFGDPNVFGLVADTLRFFAQADDPEAFCKALAEGDFDRAFAMVDKSDEELHEEITALRESATEIVERYPDAVQTLIKRL